MLLKFARLPNVRLCLLGCQMDQYCTECLSKQCCYTKGCNFCEFGFFFLLTERTAGQSNGSNFQWRNLQKVQFNTDLLKDKHGFYTENDGVD